MRFTCIANFCHEVVSITDIDHIRRTETPRSLKPRSAPTRHRNLTSQMFAQGNKHQADWAGAKHKHMLPCSKTCVFNALNNACQRLDQRRVAKVRPGFELE